MTKKNIRIILLIWDIVAIFLIFFSLIMMFEIVIKNLLIDANIHTFYETVETVQSEYRNAVGFLENKRALPYNTSIGEIVNYLRELSISKFKYDDSLVMIVSHDPSFKNSAATNKSGSFDFSKEEIDYKRFYLSAAELPERIDMKDYNLLEKKVSESDLKYLLYYYKTDDDLQGYTLTGFPNKDDSEKLRKIYAGSAGKRREYVDFAVNGKAYIGVAYLLAPPINKNLDSTNIEKFNPLIVVADSQADFFSMINNIRNIFLAILGGIILIIFIIKVYNTFVITREIKEISDTIKDESVAIEKKGQIGTALKKMKLMFRETATLYDSYSHLSVKLGDVGEIISGIADKDLFAATLRNDKSILDPHEVNMSILFLDVKGFTTISELFKEKSMGIINEIWSVVESIVYKNSGKINKYIGDAALIIFPEIIADNKDASTRNAVLSAVSILESVTGIKEKLNIDFNFRIGIDYGRLVYGKTGSNRNYELGVIGDPVNTAARFEALNKKYNTNILLSTEALLNTGYEAGSLYALTAEPVKEYSFYMVDRARPQGKKESKNIYTIRQKQNDQFQFIGSDALYPRETFAEFSRFLDDFLDGIRFWQEDNREEGARKWSAFAKQIGAFYHNTGFPLVKIFLNKIIKYEEIIKYESDPVSWMRQEDIQIKIPDAEWIKYGTVELSK